MQTEADTSTKTHNWCVNVSRWNWGNLLWIHTQWCTATRPYNRLCDKEWVLDERITSCPLFAMGKWWPKNWQRSRWYCLCFHWQIHNSSYTSSSTWKWTWYQTDGQPTETYTFWLLSQKQILPFGFPKPPATKTSISWPHVDDNDDEMIEKAKSLLQSVQNILTRADVHNMSTQHFLQEINLDIETYMDALKISQRGTNVILKWNWQDVFINACNHDILSLWRGNVDLQYLIHKIAIVKYVSSYMTKGEKGMGETLKRVAKDYWKDAIQKQMNKIKKEFLGKWVLGALEAAMWVLSIWLMKKSRKVVSVSTSMKDECVSLPKPKSWLTQLHDDDKDISVTSLIDIYAPRQVSLQNICLTTFAVTYDVIQLSTNKEETEGVNAEEE